MTQEQMRVEIGAWVESTTPKKNGAGMRKAWVTPTPKGESARLSVIVTHDGRETLRVGTPEERAMAQAALGLALSGIPADALKAPAAPRKAPTPPAKAPTPITRNPAPAKPPLASLPKPAPATGRTLAPATSAPSGAGWFADLMAEAEGR